jgi:hypothetical protein
MRSDDAGGWVLNREGDDRRTDERTDDSKGISDASKVFIRATRDENCLLKACELDVI